MAFLNIFMTQQPEAYVSSVDYLLDDKGELVEQVPRNFFKSTLMPS